MKCYQIGSVGFFSSLYSLFGSARMYMNIVLLSLPLLFLIGCDDLFSQLAPENSSASKSDSSGSSTTVILGLINPIEPQKPDELQGNSITVNWKAQEILNDMNKPSLSAAQVSIEIYYKKAEVGESAPSINEVMNASKYTHTYTADREQAQIQGLESGQYYYVVLKSIDSTDTSRVVVSDQSYKFITHNTNYAPQNTTELINFVNQEILNQGNSADLNMIDTSVITDMSQVFKNKTTFNGDVSLWNVSNVTNMSEMFENAFAFNGDIGNWVTSKVTNMESMFKDADAFNRNLNKWNVSNVTNMQAMFKGADVFDGDISEWDVSSVINMHQMFYRARAFSKHISNWNVENVENLGATFYFATSFNHDLIFWNTAKVTIWTDASGYLTFDKSALESNEPEWCTVLVGCKLATRWIIPLNPIEPQKPGELTQDSINVHWESPDFSGSSLNPADVAIELYYKKVDTGAAAPTVNEVLGAQKYDPTIALSAADTTANITGLEGGFNYYVVQKMVYTTDQSRTAISDKVYKFTTYSSHPDYAPRSYTELKNVVNSTIASLGNNADLNIIDTSAVTNLTEIFWNKAAFNGDVSLWDVRNVTSMSRLFESARAFNGDLSEWDVSSVTDFTDMFHGATIFNSDLSKWNVSNAETMQNMFASAYAFNSDLSEWKVGKVTNMSAMFYHAEAFDGDISKWDVSSVTTMWSMFLEANSFNRDISDWIVTDVEVMSFMFYGADVFSGDLSNWNVGNVTEMAAMFSNTKVFNSDLSEWKVGSVTNMSGMFEGALAFNSDIKDWDVSSATNMSGMFKDAAAFNQDLDAWGIRISNVTNWGGTNSFPFQNSGLEGREPSWCTVTIGCKP